MSFPQAARQMTGKQLGERVQSSTSKFLEEGTHQVRVLGVDRSELSNNKLTVKYSAGGGEHNDRLYFCEVNRKTGESEISWRVAATLGMLIPSQEAYDAFMAEVHADNDEVLDLLVGLEGQLTLARGKGFGPAEVLPDGTYCVRNTDPKRDEVYFGSSVEEAQQSAQAAGLKRAFMNISRYECVAGAANLQQFSTKMAALHSPKKSVGFKVAV